MQGYDFELRFFDIKEAFLHIKNDDGNVIEYLESEKKDLLEDCEILACGPHIMLKACPPQ